MYLTSESNFLMVMFPYFRAQSGYILKYRRGRTAWLASKVSDTEGKDICLGPLYCCPVVSYFRIPNAIFHFKQVYVI